MAPLPLAAMDGLAAGLSGSDVGQPRGNGVSIVILILFAIPWLTVTTAVIGACRVAARGDAVELEIDRGGLEL